ncbi:MAG: transketolase [Rhodospirillales bacterium]|nr:transketolase [Rhodospirillales bacterium]
MTRPQPPSSTLQSAAKIDQMKQLGRKVLWLACWMIHNANHIRPSRDGIKVGGHQASCASAATLLTALYMDVLRPEDRIAVKPHASPVFHAIQYLLGNQTLEKLQAYRGLGGAQAYPSRMKDTDDVDFSTGSVGLGVGMTLFASLVQDYVRLHEMAPDGSSEGRIVTLMGDAELDEGNVFEALLEGWKHDVRNLWWVIDYNRQSLDGVVNDHLFQKIKSFFSTVDWEVVTIKYGKRLQAAFEGPAGGALNQWIDECPNQLYAALTYKGGASWREHLKTDLKGTSGLKEFLDVHDDDALHRLMTNLGGHDMEAVLEAFHGIKDDAPRCFVAYTVKGFRLPLAGHKDNHSGLMTLDQMAEFKLSMGIAEGREWDPAAGLDMAAEDLQEFLDHVPFNKREPAPERVPTITTPEIVPPNGGRLSTQEAFGRIMNDFGKSDSELASRIVTTSPDVTVSTNLGGWVNQRRLFHSKRKQDVFREENVPSAQKWSMSPTGQHMELGIAENNLFLMLAALGLSEPLFGARLLPVGTVYDIFIGRGLDALNYACYQDARFMLVGTPSGITLAPEGGAHQSTATPLIAMGQSGLTGFEPAYSDELAIIMDWGFQHMQADDGGAVYLRLTTRPLDQDHREITPDLKRQIVEGGYWLRPPAPDAELAIITSGVLMPEALAAYEQIVEDIPGVGLLNVTSADRLHSGWASEGNGHAEHLLSELSPNAALVTVLDGHSGGLGWMGSVSGHRTFPLGVDQFGQTGDIPDLYRTYKIDSEAIIDACARACLAKR